jgi:hypothetical protein
MWCWIENLVVLDIQTEAAGARLESITMLKQRQHPITLQLRKVCTISQLYSLNDWTFLGLTNVVTQGSIPWKSV